MSKHGAEETVTIAADCGLLTGRADDGVVTVFNIPYGVADPFGAATPAPGGDHNGTSRTSTEAGSSASAGAESDLVVTVTAPASGSGGKGNGRRAYRPVLVWIHGGAYAEGNPSEPWCDASALARAGIVIVSFGYRKRLAGFWTDRDQDQLTCPTRGVSDTVLALQWLDRNIGAFGGDASNITLSGQSAGAGIALALATAVRHRADVPQPRRIIAMSPAFSRGASSAFRRLVVAIAARLHRSPSMHNLGRLATSHPDRIEAAFRTLQKFTAIEPAVGVSAAAFSPSIPTLVTTTSEEFHFMPILRTIDSWIIAPLLARGLAAALGASLGRLLRPLPKEFGARPCAGVVSDGTVRRYAAMVAQRTHDQGIPVWAAQFRPGEGKGTGPNGQPTSGAPHCIDLPRFFGRESAHPFHHMVLQFITDGTIAAPEYGDNRTVTQFYGANDQARTEVDLDSWAAPKALYASSKCVPLNI